MRGRQRELDGHVVQALPDGHREVADGGGADGVGERAPRGHAAVGGVHAELIRSVAESGRLAVPVSDLEEGRGRRRPGGSQVLRRRCSRGDCDAGSGGDLELVLIDHPGVRSGLHGGRSVVVGRGVGIGPVLRGGVVEVNNDRVGGPGDSACFSVHVAAAGNGHVAFDAHAAPEGRVEVCGGRAGAGEDTGVGSEEAGTVGLGLYVTRVLEYVNDGAV